jgi:hypothetical protein
MSTSISGTYPVPGVYREAVFSTSTPDLLTGVPVFLGLTAAHDAQNQPISINQPRKLTLWNEFQQYFGQPLAESYLAYAVRGFFENGGQVCYVLRLEDMASKALETALLEIKSLDTVDLVCVPDLATLQDPNAVPQVSQLDLMQQMQDLILQHCERMGDRFAILDAPKNISVDQLSAQVKHLDSPYGALYTPWLKVLSFSNSNNDFMPISVPSCGHLAGIYARSDRDIGTHKTPANYPLEGVVDLSTPISHADQTALNPETGIGINCLRSLPGRGIRVWGTRTLSSDPNWKYINVRRLFLMVRRWIEQNLAEVTFEPNDFNLWVRIERELIAYLESLLRQGALQGRTPQEAFYVKCNAETNSPEVRDIGQVVTEIGLAPTIPSEFIVIRLIHGDTGVMVEG